jgi:pimeloyl-ACP methyl ester carboxylesterase
VTANGIDIEYESMGTGEPLVLIMGIGAQLVDWPQGFCQMLVERGFRVIRFDHRDVGLSTRFPHARVPRVRKLIARWLLGRQVPAPYTLSDMAADTAGLLDALGIDSAHVLGVSMGGMIAQTLAIEHPSRVRTLTSVMSTTGERRGFLSRPHALRALLMPAPRNRDEAMDRAVAFFRTVGSPQYPFDEAAMRERAGRAFDRGMDPRGFLRHMAAILASGSRRRALRRVRAPTLVIHGQADPLIPVAGGRSTARAIPGARLRVIPGMGHDLAEGLWRRLVDEVARHALQGEFGADPGPAGAHCTETSRALGWGSCRREGSQGPSRHPFAGTFR